MILSARLPRLLFAGLPALTLTFSPLLQAGPGGSGYGGGSSVSSIAEREMIRRLERVKDAEKDIADGQRLEGEKDFEGARQKYLAAINKIPKAPLVQAKRDHAIKLFANVSVKLADQMAREGRRGPAADVLNAVLSPEVDPYNKDAKKILVRLDDPEWYNHALTPKHVENVGEVDRLLKVGKGYYDLGDFDNAEKQFDAVLRVDRYNMAARRGQQEVEMARRSYLDSARDHTRLRMLRQVDEVWETSVPAISMSSNPITSISNESSGREYLARKLRETIIPQVLFDEATVDEALEFLRQKSRDHDPFETDESAKGVNIVRKNSGPGPDGAVLEEQTISLRLSNVPLAEALRYVAEGAGMKYKIEPYTVVIVPIWQDTTDMYTRTFRVAPDFITSADAGGDGGGGDVVDDPFATGGDGPRTSLTRKKGAKEVLMTQGITFPEGASAFYNARNSTLVVRNTQANMELIETLVDNSDKNVPNQIFITTKFIEITQQNLDEFGFDWMLGQFNTPGSDRVFAGGGTVGNQRGGVIDSTDYTFVPPAGGGGNPVPTGRLPVTSGLRFGLDALQTNAIDGLLNEELLTSNISPGIFGIGGVLTDPQFQVVIRALNQRKGSDLMTAPSVVTRSGQRAKIEVIREFIYPTEYDPPEIPQNFGGGGNNNGGGGGGGGLGGIVGVGGAVANSFPVTPANPTAFEMRPVGVTLEVDPVVGADGFTIELNIAPEVVEFEGFINYGSPIQTSAIDALGQPTTVVLTENRIEQPVFATRKLTTAVTIWDGQTVAIGGLIREDIQHVEDKVPIFGDLPILGRFFRTSSETHFKRNLMIFVTAKLIDPSGQEISKKNVPDPLDAGAGAGAGAMGMGAMGMGAGGGRPDSSLFDSP
jgi:general secretion pathway protein D